MRKRSARGTTALREELPALLAERGVSYRQFAKEVGVPQSYLSRVMHATRSPSKKLLKNAARALGLPHDYFAEYREHVVVEAIKRDGALRDNVYDSQRLGASDK